MNKRKQISYGIFQFFAGLMLLAVHTGCSAPILNPPTPTYTATLVPSQTPSATPTVTPTAIPTPLGGGSNFIFSGTINRPNCDVYMINVNSKDLTQLTEDPACDIAARWSPDGSKVAFMSDRSGNFDIFVMNSDGTDQVNLTISSEIDSSPSWSPDGTKLAYASGPSRSGGAIYIMNADGTEKTKLVKFSGTLGSLDWSPDGTKIVYDAGPGWIYGTYQGHHDIYVVNIDGSGSKNLTNDSPDDAYPSWSRDGSRISFASNRQSQQDSQKRYGPKIYVMNSDGSEVKLLLGSSSRGAATWSPDGMKVAMISGVDNDLSIYVLNSDFTCCIRSIPLPREFELGFGVDWIAP